MSPTRPSLAEVLDRVITHRLGSLRLCMPGTVVSYDATKQTASIQPAFKNVIASGDDNDQIVLDFPVIDLVPVCFPRSGQWSITWPLSPGDAVSLFFTERALDQWRLLGDQGPQDPAHIRVCDLSDAIAYPVNLETDSKPITIAAADHLVIGNAAGATIHVNADHTIGLGAAVPGDSAATALKVNAELAALKTLVAAIGPDLIALYVLLGIPSPWATVSLPAYLATGAPHDVASTIVKVSP